MKKWFRDNIVYQLLKWFPDRMQKKLKLVCTCLFGTGWDYFYMTPLACNFSEVHPDDVKKIYADLPEDSLHVLLEYLRYCHLANYFDAAYNNALIVPKYPLFRGLKEKIEEEKLFCDSVHLPAKMSITAEVFYHHHGLKTLPIQIHSYIAESDFLDLGAWVGDSAYILSKYKPHNILSFEPSPVSCRDYVANVKKLGIKNTILIPAGASDEKGFLHFNDDGGMLTLEESGSEKVAVVRIDDYLSANKTGRIGLIKADLEGTALKMLHGAINAIKKDRPVLLIAIYHNAEEFLGVYQFLKKELPNYCYKVMALAGLSEVTLIAWPAEVTGQDKHIPAGKGPQE